MAQASTPKRRTFTEVARRAQILDAAIETIAELGYANASFGRIAQRAELSSTGMISYYFDGKDELDGEVIATVLATASAFVGPRIAAAQGHRERLGVYIRANLDFVAEYPAHTLALVQVVTASNYRALGLGQFVDAFEQVADQLRAGQRAGELGAFDADVMAIAIRGAIDAMVGASPATATPTSRRPDASWPRPSIAAHDRTRNGPRGDTAGPLRGVATLLVDLALPVALFYALRAGGVDQLTALLISGAPPALRVAVTFARRRRLDAIGALVAVAVVLSVVSSLIEGDPRTLLVRNAVLGFPFALWMFASLNARRPLTYESAKALLPRKDRAFERVWAAEPSFRRVWRRLAVLWGCALLLQSAANVVMAYTLPVDAVPGLDTGPWIAMFVALQIIAQIALHRVGAMRMVFAA